GRDRPELSAVSGNQTGPGLLPGKHATWAACDTQRRILGCRRRKLNMLNAKAGPRIRHTALEGGPYETIRLDKLTPVRGAEVGGAALPEPLSNRQFDEVYRALAENLVIFFRDQTFTPEQHIAFARRFGELHVHPAAPHADGIPELMTIYADKDTPR